MNTRPQSHSSRVVVIIIDDIIFFLIIFFVFFDWSKVYLFLLFFFLKDRASNHLDVSSFDVSMRILSTRTSRWTFHFDELLLSSGCTITVGSQNWTTWRNPLSVDPRNWNPLWRCVYSLNSTLQLCNCFLNIVVYNCQIEKVSIRLLQHIRLFCQALQASVVLKKYFSLVLFFISIYNWNLQLLCSIFKSK